MSRKHSDLAFLKQPQPWTDDFDFRLAEKETIATALYEIALLKGLLEIPGTAADKIEYAELIDRWMDLCADLYDGPWPDALTPEELRQISA
jgi:hypothetical protein